MMTGLAIVVNVGLVLALVGFFSGANTLLGPAGSHGEEGMLPYETGMLPIEPAIDRMSVLYYRFAVLFVVFDVDLAFLLPWALNRPALDLSQVVAVTMFIALVLFMLAYFWRKGVLECK